MEPVCPFLMRARREHDLVTSLGRRGEDKVIPKDKAISAPTRARLYGRELLALELHLTLKVKGEREEGISQERVIKATEVKLEYSGVTETIKSAQIKVTRLINVEARAELITLNERAPHARLSGDDLRVRLKQALMSVPDRM